MQKATTDDIGAICSRIDAQTVILIELAADGDKLMINRFTKRYDLLAENFRNGIVD
jgi:hypothetical protein